MFFDPENYGMEFAVENINRDEINIYFAKDKVSWPCIHNKHVNLSTMRYHNN